MQEAESGQGQDALAEEVMDSLGHPEDPSKEEVLEGEPRQEDELPLYAKEKIGKLQKRHQRDMRRMQERLDLLSSRLEPPQDNQSQSFGNSYANESTEGLSQDEVITRAVTAALQHKDVQERRAKDAEQTKYVHNQYQRLQDHLDNASDKYDDFDEVVRGHDVPFTPAMREASLLIDNPGDVLYKLGKNRDELNRIAKLHPLEQAKEINRLSFALMGGNNKGQQPQKPLGQIKNNPVSSRAVNENTSISELRERMKQGWK